MIIILFLAIALLMHSQIVGIVVVRFLALFCVCSMYLKMCRRVYALKLAKKQSQSSNNSNREL